MKLKINKSCDLSSISVLPPHARRTSTVPGGTQSSQPRPQQMSQQSFSQGISSQRGMSSQLSQNSIEDILTTSQRYSSQERECSVPKVSTMLPANYTQEENQIAMSRNSSTYMRKWNSTSVSDNRCHISEELERRMGLIETSLSRLGMILNSVQGDVMQACKGTKEISLEMDSIRQKVISNDNSLQLVSKVQDDIKANLDGGLKSLSDQLSKAFSLNESKFMEICSSHSAFPGQMELAMQKFQDHLISNFSKEMQDMASMLKLANQKSHAAALPSSEDTDVRSTISSKTELVKHVSAHPVLSLSPNVTPKIEIGGWTSVKQEKAGSLIRLPRKEQKQNEISTEKVRVQGRELAESDDDIGQGFSCLIDKKDEGAVPYLEERRNFIIDEVEVDAERILKKARKRKRFKSSKSKIIIIN